MTSRPSMSPLKALGELVTQHPSGTDRHSDAHNDATLRGLSAEVRHHGPADNAHDMIVGLDRHAGHVETIHDDRLGKRQIASVVLHQSSPFEKVDRNVAIIAAREAGATFAKIGTRFGISSERARQIYNRTMWRARRRAA